ncbi:Disease resistance response protein [Parasponia andersonii]|uniref:Dirigent protein n=1 Tax=Parasponia andersonii TaxID=3476 RepID=A0A2P5DPY0_PARAD|nr:Disease resistance response protein [Parasponia andersonii]
MAKFLLTSKSIKATVYLLFLAIIIGCANSARILDEADPQPGFANPLSTPVPIGVLPQPNPTGPALLPSGQIPAVAVATAPVGAPVDDAEDDADSPIPEGGSPNDNNAESPEPVQPAVPAPAVVAPIPGPTTGASATTGPGPIPTGPKDHPTLSFFMHDIIGGSHPTARVVTGLVANTVENVPFSKPNNNIFPVNGATPLTNSNINGFLNNNRNNLPFLTGLNGNGLTNAQTSTVIQNSGNNNIVGGGGNTPFVTAGQLPAGVPLQKLMFGSVTVIDDELTEAHELGSTVIGRAQGFYLASSLDGNSHTMVLTAVVHGGAGGGHVTEDTISVFGVHRTATPVSHIAVIGGTGKFENAQGYATVESLPQVDQHTTDGVDTIMHVNVYLSHE